MDVKHLYTVNCGSHAPPSLLPFFSTQADTSVQSVSQSQSICETEGLVVSVPIRAVWDGDVHSVSILQERLSGLTALPDGMV